MQSELCDFRTGNKALKVYRRITRPALRQMQSRDRMDTSPAFEREYLAHNRGNVRAWTSEVMSICMEDVSGLRTASADYYSNHDPPGWR